MKDILEEDSTERWKYSYGYARTIRLSYKFEQLKTKKKKEGKQKKRSFSFLMANFPLIVLIVVISSIGENASRDWPFK